MEEHPAILLIDNDEDDHIIFKTALHEINFNYVMFSALDADEGLIMFQNIYPDFVFLDMNMPHINGLEFLEIAKNHDNKQSLEMIIYSTYITEDICKQALDLGAKMCVKKPNSMRELKEILHNIFIDKTLPYAYLFKPHPDK